MFTKDFGKAQRSDPMRRCQYINPITADGCEAPPQIGKPFCYVHDPDKREERAEAQRRGGLNRRQPEPPPRIPPNLPYMKLESRTHILLVFEVTMNYVLQGQMDLRAANTLGYLATGALSTLDSTARAERQAKLDAERAAEKAEKKAEKEAEKAAKAKQEGEKAAPEAWPLYQKEKQAEAEARATQQAKPENRAARPGPDDLTAHNFEGTAPSESGEKKPEARDEIAHKPAAENGAGAPNQAERRLPFFLRKRRVIATQRPAPEHESARDGLNHG
jgi:hypothetical protein